MYEPYIQIRLTPQEIRDLREALAALERENQDRRRRWLNDWRVRTSCERNIDKARHLDRVLDSCVPHND